MWEAINKDQGRGEDRRGEERGGGGEERRTERIMSTVLHANNEA